MPGPLSSPTSIRQDRKNVQATWTVLPAAGRPGDPPAWPLPKPTAREKTQWAREWRRPQAVEWERDGQIEEVGIYVRTLIRCQEPTAGPSLIGQLRAMQLDLGLSQPGLLRRHWKIEDELPVVKRTNDANRTTAKARFQVLTGEAAG